jgi:ElaB/YqjD/DUF883 family membrane-anchored ribosome-binding protein
MIDDKQLQELKAEVIKSAREVQERLDPQLRALAGKINESMEQSEAQLKAQVRAKPWPWIAAAVAGWAVSAILAGIILL